MLTEPHPLSPLLLLTFNDLSIVRDTNKGVKLTNEEFNQKIIERYLSTQSSLWNAIITFNSIILGVISILYYVKPNVDKSFILSVFIICASSISLIIINILITKYTYLALGKIDEKHKNYTPQKKEKVKKKDNVIANIKYYIQNSIEFICLGAIIFNLIKITLWLYSVK